MACCMRFGNGLLLLQRLPSIACLTTATYVAYILYVLAAPNGLKINTLSAQAILILLCTCGAGACILTTLFIPVVVSKFGSMAPREAQIKRMNLLGLVSPYRPQSLHLNLGCTASGVPSSLKAACNADMSSSAGSCLVSPSV